LAADDEVELELQVEHVLSKPNVVAPDGICVLSSETSVVHFSVSPKRLPSWAAPTELSVRAAIDGG